MTGTNGSAWAVWVPFAGPLVASGTALWISVRQNAVGREVAAGAQRERAALTAISEEDGDFVTITNHGATPVFDLRIDHAWREVLSRDGKDGPFIVVEDEAQARVDPQRCKVLPPGVSQVFTFVEWLVDDGPVEEGDEVRLSPVVKVLFRFTDPAQTRWERQANGRPYWVAGTPLPGTVGWGARRRKWLRRKYGATKRNLRYGFQGKGFTRWGRRRIKAETALIPRVRRWRPFGSGE
ncbi:hypothetical protein [Streptomyces filamentosus]|uniref:hypothetical protein n=1 Tax=Streptomyces filamentosus TaxID=67294 RepID=UPI0033EF56BD